MRAGGTTVAIPPAQTRSSPTTTSHHGTSSPDPSGSTLTGTSPPPERRHWDLAWALHSFAGLWPEAGHSDPVVVQRIAAFCDAARVAVSERPALLHTVVERTAHNAAELRRRSDAGETAYRRMVDEGHADGWERGSDHVADNLDRWVSRLEH